MRVVVLVPRRADGGHRDRLWEFCRKWWLSNHPDWPVFEGESPVGPFNRSAAINTAARAAGDWDVALIIDSDIIANPEAVAEIVDVAATNRMCVSHRRRVMCTQAMTDQILDGYSGSWERGRQTVFTDSCSCCVAVSRTVFDELGGFDEKFIGWGFEDSAFALRASVEFGAIYYADSTLFHLWHPVSAEADHKSSTWHQNKSRLRRIEAELDGPPTIPKILHRTVPAETTSQVEAWWEKFKKLHPEWECRTWREELDPADFPLTSGVWGMCENGAQKAGLIRLELLFTHGGVYVDSDCEPFRPLDELLPLEAFAAWEDETTVPDAVLGARAGHPAFKKALDLAVAAVRKRKGAWVSGPGVTTRLFPTRTDVTLLPPGAFYKAHYLQKRDLSDAPKPYEFLRHHWHHSWGSEESKQSIVERQR